MKLRIVGAYDGHSVKKDGTVVLKFVFPFSEMAAAIRTVLTLGKEVALGVRTSVDDKQTRLVIGMAVVNNLRVDRDGEVHISFESDVKTVNLDRELVVPMLERTVTVFVAVEDSKP